MNIGHVILAISFIILAVWYADCLTKNFINERLLMLRVGIILVICLLAMWIVDIVIFSNLRLLHEDIRNKIISMIEYLFVGLVLAIIVNKK